MNTYEIFTSKEERLEIINSFDCVNPFWQQQEGPSHYVSFEANVSMDIDPHLPLRCEERFVSADAFFLAMETFFNNDGVDEETEEELPSVADLMPGDWVDLCDTENNVRFIFQYVGFDNFTGMDEIFCKTTIPFKSFEAHTFRKGYKVFELSTEDNGEFKINYVNNSKLKFK